MSTKTSEQRYNDNLFAIFDRAKVLKQEQDDLRKFIGRNINQKDDLFYVTWSESDFSSRHDKRYKRDHFSTYRQASEYMTKLRANGSCWYDPHFDPTI